MAPSAVSAETCLENGTNGTNGVSYMKLTNGKSNGVSREVQLLKEPLQYQGLLDEFKSVQTTPVIGTEFPDANVVEWMKAPNADAILKDLAVTISRRGVVFFRSQSDLTDELQKELADKLGHLVGKPSDSSLHIHPLVNSHSNREDKHLNIITTDKAQAPAEDLFKNQAERPLGARGCWHTDIGYEPHPSDYTILKIVKTPPTGGDTMWASSCEIYDKISPAYRKFLEGLTATFAQARYPKTAREKGFDLYSDPRGSPANAGVALQTVHPVVRTNPVTGWKSLFAVGNHVQRINELTSDESKRLHDYFLQLIVESHDCQLRHRWENLYDIAIWDNRTVFHAAIMDYAGLGARTGHRAVGIGERPYFDPNSKTRREAMEAASKTS
ncbi:hypothetical protein F5Y15DRAFT_262953 [Xylariaceae sp. FL0016]|nr:hypothetical protein F5Y15DRAFT_262953 [Xylariaceae sp. FL0016]